MIGITRELENTNLMRYMSSVIIPSIGDTLIMVLVSAIFSIFFGIFLGIILVMTDKNGLSPHPIIHGVLAKITDIIRSFPMMILIVAIAPITRFFIGTKIGVQAAIFAIVIGSTPFATRMTENSLNTVDSQLIKMARSIGASKLQIIFKVMLVEALPTLVSNFMINMLNTSAMAGAVGAGGLGAVALTYGYQRFDYLIMYFIVIILIFLVMLIQGIGNKLYKLTK